MKIKNPFQDILIAFCAFIGLLITLRIIYTGSALYLFLVWNLFLAWVPYGISSLFIKLKNGHKWKYAALFCCWLAFFPNALYIITDLIHIEHESAVPKWFDALLLFAAALLGLIFAFISLFRIEMFFSRWMSRKLMAPLMILILFLGSFGVYLGRFLRWNSWDILGNPFSLLLSVGQRIISPYEHAHTGAITALFTLFFYLLYNAVKKMPGYLNRAGVYQRG